MYDFRKMEKRFNIRSKLIQLMLSIILKEFLFFLFLSSYVLPQNAEISFETLAINQDTPSLITSILQDKKGYLWFGTWSGLYKFDGYAITNYKHNLDDSTSLIDNSITELYEDKSGVLWIGSYLGLDKYNPITNTFTHFIPNPSSIGKDESNTIWTIQEDKFGILWIGTGNGLFKLNKATGKFIHLEYDSTDPGSISHNSILIIREAKDGTMWFGTGAGLDRLDFKTGKFIHYWRESPNREKIIWTNNSKYWIETIFEDNEGILWLGTNGGLVEFNAKEGTFLNYLFTSEDKQNRINAICQDEDSGSLWLGTVDGLLAFDKKIKKFSNYFKDVVNQVYYERSGTLWIGTDTGIKKIKNTKMPFKKYFSKNPIFAIGKQTEKILWMFTFNGWLKFDINKDKFVKYSLGKGNNPLYLYPGGELIITKTTGGCLKQDSLGRMTTFINDSLKEFVNSLSWGWKTKDGYWLGTQSGGLFLLNPDNDNLKEIRNLKLSINNIYEDKSGFLWISTFMGRVFRYNPKSDSLKEYISDIKNLSSISGIVVNQIYEDNKGRLWFATNTGLNRLERSTNSFIRFTIKEGLASSDIRGILEDDHGFLWLNTTKGISKFDPENRRFINYGLSYGLEGASDTYYGIGCKTVNGEIYFPNLKGFTRFHPDSIKENPFIPPIVITSFKKFDKPYPFSDKIELPYDENFLSFEFAALSFTSPERNQYAYKMEGIDKDWVYSETRRYASYPNLSPGKYIFRVKGSNNDGVWNEAGASLFIYISPPWWKTWWAYSLYILLFAGIIYSAWRIQINQIQLKHKAEIEHVNAEKILEVDKMKSQFFANISHEFRTPLTLILGPVKQIAEKIRDDKIKDELGVVYRNASRLLQLVNQLLDLSKLESGKLKLEASKGNIVSFVKGIALSFESLSESKDISLKLQPEKEYIELYFDKEKMTKILSNILSNAFKFTPEEGKIIISIKERSDNASKDKKNNFVEIKIKDTGIGIPKSELPKLFDRFYQVDSSHTREYEGTGIGLAITKELVDLHHGSINAESEIGNWTEFTILLPSGREHLKDNEIINEEFKNPEELMSLVNDESFLVSNNAGDEAARDIKDSSKNIVLIVEDNYDMREYIKKFLSKDYLVEEAVNGEQGVRKAKKIIPDLIISDIMMPKMDGNELTKSLKDDEKTCHIPIIILTAKSGQENKIEGLKTGADDYLIKPFDIEELLIRVENLINIRKKLQEKYSKEDYLLITDGKKIQSIDEKFMNNVIDIIGKHLSEEEFSIEEFSGEIGMSRSQLHRKIRALTGKSPSVYMRTIRLLKGKRMIEEKTGNISEIAYSVGFSSPAYFTRCFKEEFGYPPSDLAS